MDFRSRLVWLRRHGVAISLVLGLALAGFSLGLFLARHGPSGERAVSTAPAPASTSAPPPATTPPSGASPSPQVSAVGAFDATIAWTTSDPTVGLVSYGPSGVGVTRWLPPTPAARAHEVALTGLAFSTAYHVDVTSTSASGQPVAAGLDFTTQGPPLTATPSSGAGWIRLAGRPWFPLMVYGQCSSLYESSLATGITLYANNPCGGIEAQLTALGGRALSAVLSDEEDAGDAAGVVGAFYPDEADDHGYTAGLLPAIAAPGLRFLTLSNHFYSGADPPAQGRGVYRGLVARADVVGFDLYPLQGWCASARLVDVYLAQRELAALAADKPTFQWIEAAGMNCPTDPANAVTPETVRAESWLAILGGARALGYFPAAWTGDVGSAISTVKADVTAFLPALLATPVASSTRPGSPVVVGAWQLDGAVYVAAVNPSGSAIGADLHVPGAGARTATVVGEQRSVVASGDVLHDAFAPLAVHLYVFPPPGR